MRVTLYTTPNCQPCRLTKMKMDKLGVPFEEVLLDDDTLDYVKSLGHNAAPVIEADYGEGVTTSWSGGYRPELIQQLKDTL